MMVDERARQQEDMGRMLQGAKATTAHLAHRADARAREIQSLRASLAALQLKLDTTQAALCHRHLTVMQPSCNHHVTVM